MTRDELKKKYPKVYEVMNRGRRFTVSDVAKAMKSTYTTADRLLNNLEAPDGSNVVFDTGEVRRTGRRGAPAKLWRVSWR